MRTRTTWRLALSVLAGLAVFAACGRTIVHPHVNRCVFDTDCPDGLRCVNQVCRTLVFPDAGGAHGTKRFGEPCDGGLECESAYCIGGPRGAFCSQLCDVQDTCPTAYGCKTLLDPNVPDAGGDPVSLCAVPQPFLCQACQTDFDCGASGADKCIGFDGGQFCGKDCTIDGCPDHYACVGLSGTKQCVPAGKTCDCVPETLGMAKSCRGISNAFGACTGSQICQSDGGFTGCDAPQAAQDVCNGVDDDCDGLIDDADYGTCTKTLGGKTCTGPNMCLATAGLVCTAQAPEPEICNSKDDDCNGAVDEGFVDAGLYVTKAHCGTCGHDCDKVIANSASTTCSLGTDGGMRCQALACKPGFFPFNDASQCLELPDTLCRPCVADSDCVGPDARCVVIDGANVCGRDCSPTSPYAACPAGYACTPFDGGVAQCAPVTKTCLCKVSSLGSMRACTVTVSTGTCNGFLSCVNPGPNWSACDVKTYNPEICDGRDNNCDTVVDEGYRNPVTGKYDTAQNCGFCNNDCTKYYSPTIQHTTGICNAVPALPVCTMGPCLTEVVGGVTYEWVNVNGLTADGCECRRVQGNTTVDLPDRAPSTGTAPSWVDENCDGVDGVVTNAIFVSATAPAGGNGTRTLPMATVAQGLQAMQTQNKKYVLVAQGTYRENVKLFDGAQLFGGYSSDFLKRDPDVYVTTLEGTVPSATAIAALHADTLGTGAKETVVAGFTINGWDVSTVAAEDQDGQPSIAVYAHNVGPKLILMTNTISGGRGGQGGTGKTGTQGYGRQASTALNGATGIGSTFFPSGFCTVSNQRAGSVAGVNTQCGGVSAAGAGGNVICPVYTMATHQGQEQQYVNPPVASLNGRGGWDWSFDTLSGFACSHVTESGFPTSIQSHDGDDGHQGPDGAGGPGGPGAAALARSGTVLATGVWAPSATKPAAGGSGVTGVGAGGGGAGGGVVQFLAGGCSGWEIGATGGGGGAGACGGAGGHAGGAGGASIAVLLTWSGAPAGLPTLSGNRIQRGIGGNGGNGGYGGAGGLGGAGGFGGGQARWSSSVGGKGGEGGNGGPGGGGGGGTGGPSYGVLAFRGSAAGYSTTNTFPTGSTVDTGGSPGTGGSSPGPSTSTGGAGQKGGFADLLSLTACPCSTGFTCDGNGVCVPN